MRDGSIVRGSIGAIAQDSGKSLAQTFVGADVVIVFDSSGSMDSPDAPGNKTRYEVASRELATLQSNLPGKVALISFNNITQFRPNGVPMSPMGGTDLADALRFARRADVEGIRFIVISDGEPNEPEKALQVASKYKNKIDCIFVGPEDRPAGRDFLRQLAAASGGKTVTADKAAQLSSAVQQLLLT